MLKTIQIIDLANLFLARLDVTPGGSVVEFGCGQGGMIGRLSAAERLGVDFYEPWLEKATHDWPLVEFANHDLLKIDDLLAPDSYDVVVGFDILEHFPLAQAQQIMSSAERVARKGVLWWGPLEKQIRVFGAEETDGNPGMAHQRIIDISEFDGFELMLFPTYWQTPPLLHDTGFLAMKDLR